MSLTADQVLAAIEALPPRDEKERAYIGASSVGNQCDAYLAFSLRGFPGDPVEPRKQRIFDLGHLLETEIVRLLKKAMAASGLGQVIEVDHLTGRQHAMSEAGGHVNAHMDGILVPAGTNEAIGLEIKTMNGKSFAAFKAGQLKDSHPVYYAQVNMMMALGGYGKFLVVAYNKDTSDMWAEIVPFDQMEWDFHHLRVEGILNGQPPTKVGKDETDWRCRGCFKSKVCWQDAPVPELCRTCANATPDIAANSGKRWLCKVHGGSKDADHTCADWARWRPTER
jgi:hypothetical protein